MVIDIRKIRATGKNEQDFYFEYYPEIEISNIPSVSVAMPIKINGTCFLTDKHSVYIEGEVNYTLEGECCRCLTNVSRQYTVELKETAGEDENSYPVVNDTVDLTKIVEDSVLTDLPVSFLCSENCKGLCFNCGANLNTEKCKCK
ncbi:MAG: DUF177 domain-containing protein [Clostridia bacterium]|nr:DUF177 domain-containing protein [Clostridia bacterium]